MKQMKLYRHICILANKRKKKEKHPGPGEIARLQGKILWALTSLSMQLYRRCQCQWRLQLTLLQTIRVVKYNFWSPKFVLIEERREGEGDIILRETEKKITSMSGLLRILGPRARQPLWRMRQATWLWAALKWLSGYLPSDLIYWDNYDNIKLFMNGRVNESCQIYYSY